jgi:hypothetical protein
LIIGPGRAVSTGKANYCLMRTIVTMTFDRGAAHRGWSMLGRELARWRAGGVVADGLAGGDEDAYL